MQVAANLELGELDRILAEWVIPRSEYEPIALRELARLDEVYNSVVVNGELPMASAVGDDGGELWLNPHNKFRPWQCTYCSHRDVCLTLDPVVAIPLSEVYSDERTSHGD